MPSSKEIDATANSPDNNKEQGLKWISPKPKRPATLDACGRLEG